MANEDNLQPFYPENYLENLLLGLLVEKLFAADEARDSSKETEKNSVDHSPCLQEKLLNLFRLYCFILAWADPIENWDKIVDLDTRKKIRQQEKFKASIPKPIRRSISLGLYQLVSGSLSQFKAVAEASKNGEEVAFIKELLDSLKAVYIYSDLKSANKKKVLMEVIDKLLKRKKFNFPANFGATTTEVSREHSDAPDVPKEIFSEATQLISSFTCWQSKFLDGVGIAIGLIAALACGLSTGAAIFVLLVGFSLPLGFVIPLSVLIFLAGTRANFQLFSQHIPQFFQDLYKQTNLLLSPRKKFLLLPAGFLSLSVGIAAAAITYLEGMKLIALICPLVAATCPHLTIALLGILAGALLIGLTIVMFRTFIGVLQSQFSWQKIKQDFKEKWQNLNWTKVLTYTLKILVMTAAFLGLGYLDFTGTGTLAGLLGWAAADVITLAAIIGDLPFTLKTALALCNSFLAKSNSNPDVRKDIPYYFWKIVEFFSLIINALGNAALVFGSSSISRIASIACFMNSYASNRIQEEDNEFINARENATERSIASIQCKFFKSATQISEATNNELVNGELAFGATRNTVAKSSRFSGVPR